jgi:hypothetical protein
MFAVSWSHIYICPISISFSQCLSPIKYSYAPYNPRKANQDVFDSATDDKTDSLLFLVMDGHGEFGHKVSGFLKNIFSKTLFAEPSFATDVPAALREVPIYI